MKYVVVDIKDGDIFSTEMENASEAIKEAKRQWGYLTNRERKNRTFYVLESVNPDEDAEDHFDGNVIWKPVEED